MLGGIGLPVHAISVPNFKPDVPVQPGKILSSGDGAFWDAFLHDGQQFLFPQIPGNININLILYKGLVTLLAWSKSAWSYFHIDLCLAFTEGGFEDQFKSRSNVNEEQEGT